MKAFLLFSTFVLFSSFQATAGQDVNKRFEDFLNQSLAQLPNWMEERGFVPVPILREGGEFTLNSNRHDGHIVYSLTGEIKPDRFYLGAEKNIRALANKADISALIFNFDLAFGDGPNASIQGTYSLNGSSSEIFPIKSEGNFTKTDLLTNPVHFNMTCNLEVTDSGHFFLSMCFSPSIAAKFATLTLEGLGTDRENIVGMVNGWYDAQLQPSHLPLTWFYWSNYMQEIFGETPIVDIIGTTLSPTVSTKDLGKSSATIKSYFAEENNKRVKMISFSY